MGAPLSSSCYQMKGELTWRFGTNVWRHPVEVLREGQLLRITQVNESSSSNYFAQGYVSTPKFALNFSQFSRDLAGRDRATNISNNGDVTVSNYRMPQSTQLATIWLMVFAREELELSTNGVWPSLFPGNRGHQLHERTMRKPIVAREAKWPGGFIKYLERNTTGDTNAAPDVSFTITSWTNRNGVEFPGAFSGSAMDSHVNFEFMVNSIEELSGPIETRMPYLSMVFDWRPLELKRLETGCSYFVTNGVIFDDVLAAEKRGEIKWAPASDWARSHPMEIGSEAPDFARRDVNGRMVRLSELRGKFVALDFWSTTCGPCLADIPELQKIHEEFGRDGRVEVIGLALDESKRKVKAFASEHGMKWRQVLLEKKFDDEIARAYRVSGIPKVLVIGPDGKIVGYGLHAASVALSKR
jgi:peroxiredoxin